MDNATTPLWQKLLIVGATAAAGYMGGQGGGTAGAGDEVKALRADVRSLTDDVRSLRGVVDTLGVQVVRLTDGKAAAALVSGK